MRIIQYKTEQDSCGRSLLIKEKSYNYPAIINGFHCPKAIVDMFNDVYRLKHLDEEYLYLLALNVKMKPIGLFEVSHGSSDITICDPKRIFTRVLQCGASRFVLVHNHPSGDVYPSDLDKKTFDQICAGANLLGLDFADNIIIGEGYYSFIEQNEYQNREK